MGSSCGHRFSPKNFASTPHHTRLPSRDRGLCYLPHAWRFLSPMRVPILSPAPSRAFFSPPAPSVEGS
jgi:hypothetical protein